MSVTPKSGIQGVDKQLHPTVSVGCTYLSLSLIPASDMTLLICEANKRIPCESDICHM